DLPITVADPVRNLVLSCIAKKPDERPSSTANLARAATALRRGDIAAAAAAVPAILGGRPAPQTQATSLMPTANTVPYGATQATTVIGSAGAGGALLAPIDAGDAEPLADNKKKRSPWTWPLIVLIAILVLVLGGTITALVLGQNGPDTVPATTSAPATTATKTPTPTPTPTTTPTANTVAIPEGDLVGKSFDDAAAILVGLDFDLSASSVTGNAATTAEQVGTVYKVNPVGNVQRGSKIELTVYGPLPIVNAPGASPTFVKSDPSVGNNTTLAGTGSFTVSWPAYSCPSGTTLQSYTVSAVNAVVQADPGANTQAILQATDPGNVQVTYAVTCSGIASSPSPILNVTAQASTPAPIGGTGGTNG
ncbi:PASTA domain-containing protein, partial [Agreia sp.]|uniref:PASTA domain-containing protein n=1 Tax=Agreia sp. TaxID=1872416 RepID=UPI0035BC2FE6